MTGGKRSKALERRLLIAALDEDNTAVSPAAPANAALQQCSQAHASSPLSIDFSDSTFQMLRTPAGSCHHPTSVGHHEQLAVRAAHRKRNAEQLAPSRMTPSAMNAGDACAVSLEIDGSRIQLVDLAEVITDAETLPKALKLSQVSKLAFDEAESRLLDEVCLGYEKKAAMVMEADEQSSSELLELAEVLATEGNSIRDANFTDAIEEACAEVDSGRIRHAIMCDIRSIPEHKILQGDVVHSAAAMCSCMELVMPDNDLCHAFCKHLTSIANAVSSWKRGGLLLLASKPYPWRTDLETPYALWHPGQTMSLTALKSWSRCHAYGKKNDGSRAEHHLRWWHLMAINGCVCLNKTPVKSSLAAEILKEHWH